MDDAASQTSNAQETKTTVKNTNKNVRSVDANRQTYDAS